MDKLEKKLYRLYEGGPVNMWEECPLVYHQNPDGMTVTAGSLVSTGFVYSFDNGITLPYDIDGVQVVELRGRYRRRDASYIESSALKKAYLEIVDDGWDSIGNDGMICSVPALVAGCQNTIEEMHLRFIGERLRLEHLSEQDCLTSVEFIGKVLPHYDWDSDYINEECFKNCRRLRSIRGEFKAMWLMDGVFDGCESLVYLPDIHVDGIFSHAFRNCRSLPQIHLHNGLKRIGDGAFENCVSLKDMYLPNTVTKFGSYVFKNCYSLQSIHLPDKLTEISRGMFYCCSALKKVFLSNDLIEIGDESFFGCASMKSPWIPNGLKSIGEKAFWGCTSMVSIFLPDSVQSIGDDAFGNCADLTIRGSINSYVCEYALKNGIRFVEA